jgi:hypothetical protein
MTVATPLSLNNLRYEFGDGVLSTNTYNSGSGTITAPAGATSVDITAIGGGGGGYGNGNNNGYGGGGGGASYATGLLVTGGVTQFTYAVGAGGSGTTGGTATNGSNSTVTGGATVTGGGGGAATNGSPGTGGTGDSPGNNGTGNVGGDSGDFAFSPAGNGGFGGDDPFWDGQSGVAGVVRFVWKKKALSSYTRGGGLIPNHAQNSTIPTTTSGLGIGDFSGTSLNFTATVNAAASDGGGYQNGITGSINRDQVGISRANTSSTTLYGVYQTRSLYYDLLGNPTGYTYSTFLKFLGDVRSSTLGYQPIYRLGVKQSGADWAYVSFSSSGFAYLENYNGSVTTITNAFTYLGNLISDNWLFAAGDNDIELFYNVDVVYETIATQTITSGDYPFGSAAPLQAPVGAEAVTIKIWGGGAGGTGGQGGGGGGYTEILNAPINPLEKFIYTVGTGGAAGANGVATSVTSNTDIFTFVSASGGYANGAGGTGGITPNFFFPNAWENSGGASANGSSTGTSNGGAAGGAGGGAGGVGAAGSIPGGGGASGFSGARGEIQIEWKAELPVAGSY